MRRFGRIVSPRRLALPSACKVGFQLPSPEAIVGCSLLMIYQQVSCDVDLCLNCVPIFALVDRMFVRMHQQRKLMICLFDVRGSSFAPNTENFVMVLKCPRGGHSAESSKAKRLDG